MKNAVDVVVVLSHKASDTIIVRNGLKQAIHELIMSARAKDIDVILRIWCDVNLILQKKGNIILKNSRRVGPTLRQNSKMEDAQQSLKDDEIMGLFHQSTVIVSDK